MKPIDLAKQEIRTLHKGEDIDEVEAIILLILALLEESWVEQMVDAKEEIVAFLEGFVDNKPTTELDVFSSTDLELPGRRAMLAERIKDHVLTLIRRRADAALDLASERVVRDAGEALLLDGAIAVGASLDFSAAPVDALLRPAAVEDLRTLLRGHSTLREDKIRNLIDDYIKTPAIRAKMAVVVPGTSAFTVREQWHQQLESAIGVETTAWLPQTVDLWAYRWFTIGSYRALRQRQRGAVGGIIYAQATIDHKTTPFCRWVDGRTIDVVFADQQVERHLRAVMDGDVDGMIENWPWVTPGTEGDPEAPLGLPPYHIRCRTIPRYKLVLS